jgi:hypothetical protein
MERGPDRLEDAREAARRELMKRGHQLEMRVVCVDWGTVTFAADGTAFVEAVIEVPAWAVVSDSRGGEDAVDAGAVGDATGHP